MILNSPIISGSLTVTGNIITSGSITISGSIASASYASNAELLDGLDSTVFTLTSSFAAFTSSLNSFSASQNSFTASILAQTASLNAFSASILSYTASQNILNGTYTLTSSFNAQTASFTAFTSSINSFSAPILAQTASLNSFSSSVLTFTGSAATRLGTLEAYTSSLNNKTSSFATTGSNAFIGTQTITGSVLQSGSFTSTGTLTAQTLVVQTITSSVVYSSGSNIFGNTIGNTQTFTGSVLVTGSLTIAAGGNASAPIIFGSTIACSPIGCFATSCATSFIGGTLSGTTIYGSTAVCSPVGKFTSCIDAGIINGSGFCTSAGIVGNNSNNLYLSSNSAAGEISFWGNQLNTRLMTITGCGNVGIGTASPGATLDIGSGKNLNGTDPISVYTDARVASAVTGGLIGYNLRMVALAGSYTVANMYGIKTNTAVVQSGVTVTNSYGIYIGRTDDPTSGGIVTNKYALVTEATAGNVGIGTTSPGTLLQVSPGASYANNPTIQVIQSYADGYDAILSLANCHTGGRNWSIRSTNNSQGNFGGCKLVFQDTTAGSSTSVMTLVAGGNVGIGTTTPAYSLSVVSGWIHNYGAQNASGFRYENDAAGHVLNLNANNAYAQLYTSTDTSLYFGTNNDIRLKILNTGETCFKCNAYFCGSTYGIMGFGDKVMDKICYITTTTGTLCVPLDGLTYSSSFPTRAIYLYGTLLDNDAAHYAHMLYFYRNDYGGLQTCTISQSSLVHPSTAGQAYTFSVNDPGSTGKGACTLLLRFTSAGAGVAAGSYCTKMRIVVYNVPGL